MANTKTTVGQAKFPASSTNNFNISISGSFGSHLLFVSSLAEYAVKQAQSPPNEELSGGQYFLISWLEFSIRPLLRSVMQLI